MNGGDAVPLRLWFQMSGFDPTALRLVAVGALVGAGAGDIVSFPEAVILKGGLKPKIKAVAVVD